MIKGLETHMKTNMGEKLEETLARDEGISVEEARQAIKEMSFAEYVSLSEATTQGTQGTTTGAPAQTSQDVEKFINGKANEPAWAMNDPVTVNLGGNDIDGTLDKKIGKNWSIKTSDGQIMTLDPNNIGPPGESGFKDALKKLKTGQEPGPEDAGVLSTLASAAKQGFSKGLQDDVDHDELNRMRELAGIEETSSAGATCAGGIAAMPSIVGDTSNSSKPTNRLKTKNRLKRERKKLKKNQDNT